MNTSGRIETELIDDDIVYCTGTDVFTHIRNKAWSDLVETHPTDPAPGEGTSLSQSQVNDLIARFTERVDNQTKRAWRKRRVNDYEVRIKFRQQEKRGRLRRRSRRGAGGFVTNAGRRGFGDLPHIQIFDIDPNEGDKVEILNPRNVNDVTDNEGRDDGQWVVDTRKGVIRPNVSLFVPTGRRRRGARDIDNARVRMTYRYGREPNAQTVDGVQVSTAVPGDIRDAVALLTTARLIGSDQYGELVPDSGGDEPSLSNAVSNLKAEADDLIDEYRRP